MNATNDKFKLFSNAIEKKDIGFFSELEETHSSYHKILIDDFSKNRINAKNIIHYFNYLFDEDMHIRGLMSRLRAVTPLMFDATNKSSSNGDKFYVLN